MALLKRWIAHKSASCGRRLSTALQPHSWSRLLFPVCSQAARCLAELSVPHYHHEFVKRALVAAFEEPKAAPALLALLAHLGDSNQITQVCSLPKGNEGQWSCDLSQVDKLIL